MVWWSRRKEEDFSWIDEEGEEKGSGLVLFGVVGGFVFFLLSGEANMLCKGWETAERVGERDGDIDRDRDRDAVRAAARCRFGSCVSSTTSVKTFSLTSCWLHESLVNSELKPRAMPRRKKWTESEGVGGAYVEPFVFSVTLTARGGGYMLRELLVVDRRWGKVIRRATVLPKNKK